MEDRLDDLLHCEEQLRSTLHSNDKEKLRQKLALLQKEYLRTVQRLKRAERVESVRRHVRSRITRHNQPDQTKADVKPLGPSAVELEGTKGPHPGSGQTQQQLSSDVATTVEKSSEKRAQTVRFSLALDRAYTPTSGSSQDSAQIPKTSPALRLRSRRSRLRWAERHAELDQSQEAPKITQDTAEEQENQTRLNYPSVSHESEELFSLLENESPSLLLPQWNLQGHVEREETANQQLTLQKEKDCEEKPPNSSLPPKDVSENTNNDCIYSSSHKPLLALNDHAKDSNEEKQETANQQLTLEKEVSNSEETGSNSVSLVLETKDVSPHNDNHKIFSKLEDDYENGKHQGEDTKAEKEEIVNHQLTLEKEVSNCEDKTPNFDSLLVETKVSSPTDSDKIGSKLEDVDENGKQQPILRSPINPAEGKAEKTEAEGREQRLLDSCTLVDGLLFPAEYYVRTTRRMSVLQSQPDMNAVILSHLHKGRQRRGRGRDRRLNHTVSETSKAMSEHNSPGLCKVFSGLSASLDGGSVSAVPTLSRVKRGTTRRGRGRARARHKDDVNKKATDPRSNGISVALSPPKVVVMSVEPQSEKVQSEDAGSAASAAAKQETQTLIMQENNNILNQRESNAEQEKTAPEDWSCLLLPSSSQSDLSSLSSPLPPIPLLKNLLASDIQDFHLPDDQFGSLKLLKLRQIVSGVEQLISAANNMPTTNHCALSPSLSPLSHFPTPETYSEHVPGSLKQVLVENVDSNKEENTHEVKFQISNQEKQVGCCSSISKILNSVPSPEYNNVTHRFNLKVQDSLQQNSQNCHGHQMPSVNVKNCETTPLKMESMGKEFMRNVMQCKSVANAVSLPEKHRQNENKRATMPKPSDNADSECWNTESCISKMDNQILSYQIVPNNFTVIENSPRNCSKNIENSRTNFNKLFCKNIQSKANKLECEETNLAKNDNVPSQLLLSPSLGSVPCPLTLPLVGFTPRPVKPSMGAASSLSPLPLTLPPSRSPTFDALSPPALSPCASLRALSPSLSLTPPVGQDRCEAPVATQKASLTEQSQSQLEAPVQRQRVEARDATLCTLKARAGGSLVDLCCISSSSGSLSVAAAGKWAVSLWSQGQLCEWSLTHTWTFEEPVLRVFPIPDIPDQFCLTLGQLEIRQIRVLSCSTLGQTVLCARPAHMAIAAPKSRVVCCFHTPASSRLRVYTLSETSSPPQVWALVSPGALLSSLAPVDGLSDALIGMDQSGCLFIWNLVSGRVLKRLTLAHAFSHSACIRGFSSQGALFVLMQQGSEPGGAPETEQGEALLSLVAVNPRNGKSVLATGLCAPDDWCGRLSTEADVLGFHVLGLSGRGSVCVWDLEHPRDPRPVCAPSSRQGWHLARWGAPGVLLTALHTGDVTLHHYTQGTTTVIQTLRHPDQERVQGFKTVKKSLGFEEMF